MWRSLSVLFLLSSFSLNAPVVEGWGRAGHQTVADIAWNQLSSEAKTWILNVLSHNDNDDCWHCNEHDESFLLNEGQQQIDFKKDSNNFTSPLAEVSIWADDIRQLWAYKWTTPLHYVNIHRSSSSSSSRKSSSSSSSFECPVLSVECQFVYEIDCPNDTCVVGAIANYTTLMMGSNRDVSPEEVLQTSLRRKAVIHERHDFGSNEGNKQRALRTETEQGRGFLRNDAHWINDPVQLGLYMVTHLVGDVHQPLHVSRAEDMGGNAIEVYFPTRVPKAEEGKLLLRKTNLHSVWDDDMIERTMKERHNDDRNNFTASLLNQLQENDMYSKDEQTKWLTPPADCGSLEPLPDSTSPFEYYKCLSSAWTSESLELAMYLAYVDENMNEITDHANVRDFNRKGNERRDTILNSVNTILTATAALSPSRMSLRSLHLNVSNTSNQENKLDEDNSDVLPTLSEEYYKTRMAVVEQRLLQAGLRLAYLIEHSNNLI